MDQALEQNRHRRAGNALVRLLLLWQDRQQPGAAQSLCELAAIAAESASRLGWPEAAVRYAAMEAQTRMCGQLRFDQADRAEAAQWLSEWGQACGSEVAADMEAISAGAPGSCPALSAPAAHLVEAPAGILAEIEALIESIESAMSGGAIEPRFQEAILAARSIIQPVTYPP